MIYADAFILYEYHENVEFWIWWWSGWVKKKYENVFRHMHIQPGPPGLGLLCLVWVADSSPATHGLSSTVLESTISFHGGVLQKKIL
jgi:hypothetical protein